MEAEVAHARTSAELRAVDAVAKASINAPNPADILHTIFMALVDYKGFRVIAHADIATQNVTSRTY